MSCPSDEIASLVLFFSGKFYKSPKDIENIEQSHEVRFPRYLYEVKIAEIITKGYNRLSFIKHIKRKNV